MAPAKQVTGVEAFERWSAAQIALHAAQPPRRGRGRGRADAGLNPASAKIYRSIWGGWLDWLASEQLSWHAVTPADVERFMVVRAPSEAGRPAINRATMASYTRQRYFRVLQGVYRDAHLIGLIEQNPVSAVEKDGHQPQVREVDRRPQMLPPGVLELLRTPAWLEKALPMDEPREWWVLRDRASVTLAAHCGLTTGELRTLQGRDLRLGALPYRGPDSARSPGVAPAGELWVDVRDRTDRVGRSVRLPAAALHVLDPWLAARRVQLQLQRRRWSDLDEPARAGAKLAEPQASPRAPLLLASERNAAKSPGNGELTAVTLFRIFRTCLQAAYTQVPAGPD
jgi:integrase